jgi:hypothetical protein
MYYTAEGVLVKVNLGAKEFGSCCCGYRHSCYPNPSMTLDVFSLTLLFRPCYCGKLSWAQCTY